jgi:hypothetical protein
MCLERRFQRRFGDVGGIVGDSRGGHDGNHLEQVIHTEACGKELLGDLSIDPPPRFNQLSTDCSTWRTI